MAGAPRSWKSDAHRGDLTMEERIRLNAMVTYRSKHTAAQTAAEFGISLHYARDLHTRWGHCLDWPAELARQAAEQVGAFWPCRIAKIEWPICYGHGCHNKHNCGAHQALIERRNK